MHDSNERHRDLAIGLTAAEAEFVRLCHEGKPCEFEIERGPKPEIRGEVVRIMALGGTSEWPTDRRGVLLRSAKITGSLDLSHCADVLSLSLLDCDFESTPVVRHARMRSLVLTGSSTPGLNGHGARFDGDVYLADGYSARATTWLVNARVTGSLVLAGGRFLPGTHTPNFYNESDGDRSLHLSAARISGPLVIQPNLQQFKRPAQIEGVLDLGHAHCDVLVDGTTFYPRDIRINGFTYNHISTREPLTAANRKAWLSKHCGDMSRSFRAQPFEQLAATLRTMGLDAEAKEISIHKNEIRLRRALNYRIGNKSVALPWWTSISNVARCVFIEKLIGYGYRVHRLVFLLAAILAFASLAFGIVHEEGGIVLRDITQSAEGSASPQTRDDAKLIVRIVEAPRFRASAYALDNLLPLISLKQDEYWIIDPSAEICVSLGSSQCFDAEVAEWLRWVLVIMGWVSAGLLAAVVAGLVRN